MAVKLRLTRIGAKKKPFYRIVAADSNSPRNGKFLEVLGIYDPKKNPATVDLNEGAVLNWLKKGAVPTETVKNLFKKRNILNRFTRRQAA